MLQIQGQTAHFSKTTTLKLSGSNSDGSSLTIKRQNIDNTARNRILYSSIQTKSMVMKQITPQHKDKVAITIVQYGSGAEVVKSQ